MSTESLVPTASVDFTRYRPQRAGVIPWTTFRGTVLYGLGVDTQTQDLTDFGGGVQRRDADARAGALRELREESLGVFGTPTLERSSVARGETMAIFFVEFPDLNPAAVTKNFQERLAQAVLPEVSNILWLTRAELTQLLAEPGARIRPEFCRFSRKEYCLYERVRRLLATTGFP